jgi:hypothetical protein
LWCEPNERRTRGPVVRIKLIVCSPRAIAYCPQFLNYLLGLRMVCIDPEVNVAPRSFSLSNRQTAILNVLSFAGRPAADNVDRRLIFVVLREN